MKLIAFSLVGVATLAGVVAFTAPAANQESAPIFVTDIPPGYRDWRLGPVDIHRSQIMAPTTNNMAANDTAVFS